MPDPRHETEKDFMAAVVELALWNKWKVFHCHDARKSPAGWPDLSMARPGSPLLLIELKTLRGRVTGEQQAWLDVLHQTIGKRAEIWRPDCWSHIEALLVHGMP